MRLSTLRPLAWVGGTIIVAALLVGWLIGTIVASKQEALSSDGDAVRTEVTFESDATGSPAADGIPGYEEVYVNDYAQLLDPQARRRIRERLISLYDRTGIEMTVLTIDRRANYGYFGSNEAFATDLFNRWGIGNAARNDGVLVLVSRFDREMRIELGAGYPRSMDPKAKDVIDTYFLPAFRKDAYQEGLLAGVDATIKMVSGIHPDDVGKPALTLGWSVIGRWLKDLGLTAVAVIGGPLVFVLVAIRGWLRRRPVPCRVCGQIMDRLDETVDDEHLDGGQRLEEFLQSMDYDVRQCANCQHMEISRHLSWHFLRYGICPKCGYRVLESETTVTKRATTSSSGRKRIDYSCRNCDYSASETRTIPRKSKSSSSGSSRSSFGGGRSRGGGASGSW